MTLTSLSPEEKSFLINMYKCRLLCCEDEGERERLSERLEALVDENPEKAAIPV